jgi:hypothetical protein
VHVPEEKGYIYPSPLSHLSLHQYHFLPRLPKSIAAVCMSCPGSSFKMMLFTCHDLFLSASPLKMPHDSFYFRTSSTQLQRTYCPRKRSFGSICFQTLWLQLAHMRGWRKGYIYIPLPSSFITQTSLLHHHLPPRPSKKKPPKAIQLMFYALAVRPKNPVGSPHVRSASRYQNIPVPITCLLCSGSVMAVEYLSKSGEEFNMPCVADFENPSM